MTTRHTGYIVVLEDDIREDEDQAVINALRMTKGVLSVTPIPSNYELHVATERVNMEWRERILKLLNETRYS